MLTVDLGLLGVDETSTLLDMGCGGGRHAFAALRLGANVVAFDADEVELKQVHGTVAAMRDAGELPLGASCLEVQGDALKLPFEDGAFDRIIAAEVLEHIPDDRTAIDELVRVLAPHGRIAVTVPSALPERINWALSDEYHDFPGGHIRIYAKEELTEKLQAAGLEVRGYRREHALHSPYWWIRCAGGVNNPDRYFAKRYHDILVWQIMKNPAILRGADALLNPVLGKSLIVYAEKAA